MTVLLNLFISIVLATQLFLPAVSGKFHPVSSGDHNVNQLITSLNKLLDVMLMDIQSLNADTLYGVVLAEAQLNILLTQTKKNCIVRNAIKRLKEKCHILIKKGKPILPIHNSDYYNIVRVLLDSKLWTVNSTFQYGLLEPVEILNWSLEDLYESIFYGNPNEKLSDRCVVQLINSGPATQTHKCKISNECKHIMKDTENSFGYPLTHKLLYWQVFRALRCDCKKNALKKRIRRLCSRIFEEAKRDEYYGFPFKVRDLFIEQVLLCGIEGFTEFLQDKWRIVVLSWQTEEGCYELLTDPVQYPYEYINRIKRNLHVSQVPLLAVKSRFKRESSPMAFGCQNHITGLATAALALNLRYLLSAKRTDM